MTDTEIPKVLKKSIKSNSALHYHIKASIIGTIAVGYTDVLFATFFRHKLLSLLVSFYVGRLRDNYFLVRACNK